MPLQIALRILMKNGDQMQIAITFLIASVVCMTAFPSSAGVVEKKKNERFVIVEGTVLRSSETKIVLKGPSETLQLQWGDATGKPGGTFKRGDRVRVILTKLVKEEGEDAGQDGVIDDRAFYSADAK